MQLGSKNGARKGEQIVVIDDCEPALKITRTLGTTLRSSALLALYASIAVLAVAVTVALTGTLGLKPLASVSPTSPAIGVILGISGCLAALIAGGLVFTVLFGAPLTREQTTGSVIAVVASSAGARRTWVARSLALWAVAALAAIASAAASVIVMRWVWAGTYPFSEIASGYFLSMFALVPLVLLGMALIVTALGLTAGALVGTVAANIIYVSATTTMGRFAGSGISASWYAGAFAILAGVLLIAGIGSAIFVTRERVVLACR